VTALLDAVGDSPEEVDGTGDWHFRLPPLGQRVRLDQVPLPPGTPPALP
jgi:hypothetical protein